MENLLKDHSFILMEAAISEPLRRSKQIKLPNDFFIAPLIYNERGRKALERLYLDYMSVAEEASLPFIMCTPTWRADHKRVTESGVESGVNSDAVRFMKELRDRQGPKDQTTKIGGMVGCKNDCYKPQEGLSASESERFHSWQIFQLAQAGVDFLIAETLPSVEEAVGIAKAMERSGIPYIISFVIDRRGLVLDGAPLLEAVNIIDAATNRAPLGYMVNCSYPTFLRAADQPVELFNRLIGYHANASSLDHEALEGSEQLQKESVSDWGEEMLSLNRRYGIKILGGCCGTGVEHLRYLVEKSAAWRTTCTRQ